MRARTHPAKGNKSDPGPGHLQAAAAIPILKHMTRHTGHRFRQTRRSSFLQLLLAVILACVPLLNMPQSALAAAAASAAAEPAAPPCHAQMDSASDHDQTRSSCPHCDSDVPETCTCCGHSIPPAAAASFGDADGGENPVTHHARLSDQGAPQSHTDRRYRPPIVPAA